MFRTCSVRHAYETNLAARQTCAQRTLLLLYTSNVNVWYAYLYALDDEVL